MLLGRLARMAAASLGQGLMPVPESAWAGSGPVNRNEGTTCMPGAAVRSTQDRAGQGLASRAFMLWEMKGKIIAACACFQSVSGSYGFAFKNKQAMPAIVFVQRRWLAMAGQESGSDSSLKKACRR